MFALSTKIKYEDWESLGVEALIRWQHPERATIFPGEFLPIIEGTSLETDVGNWVINEALKQQSSWLEQGVKLEVSVNISSYHYSPKHSVKN